MTNCAARHREPWCNRCCKTVAAAAPQQIEAVVNFAARAYRRPLVEAEKKELVGLYQALRDKHASQEEALHGMLQRVFVSSPFLYHLEQPPAGKEVHPVSDWELAGRLSYFLWSSLPDEPLRQAAAAGRLRDPAVLVLDEPTAALDEDTEREIARALQDSVRGRTGIFITHRPALAAIAQLVRVAGSRPVDTKGQRHSRQRVPDG